MEHEPEEEANLSTHVLAPHVNKLPMPEDCLLVELQELTAAYVTEVTAVWLLSCHSCSLTVTKITDLWLLLSRQQPNVTEAKAHMTQVAAMCLLFSGSLPCDSSLATATALRDWCHCCVTLVMAASFRPISYDVSVYKLIYWCDIAQF